MDKVAAELEITSVRPNRGAWAMGPCAGRGGGLHRMHRSYLQMKTFLSTLAVRLVSDESGGEVLEYALIAGLIIVGAIAVISSVGTKVLARWTSLNASL